MELPLPSTMGPTADGVDVAAVPAADTTPGADDADGDVNDADVARKRSKTSGSGGGGDDELPTEHAVPRSGCKTALSGLPASQWQTLPVLELIYQRNKPSEPPKVPSVNAMSLSLSSLHHTQCIVRSPTSACYAPVCVPLSHVHLSAHHVTVLCVVGGLCVR